MSEAEANAGVPGSSGGAEIELPTREPPNPRVDESTDLEAGRGYKKSIPAIDPSKLLDPIRTDPIKALELRKRRLDRQADSSMPEIHYIGQIQSGKRIIQDSTEGAFCR